MRRLAVRLHLWLGLIVGGLWALQGLTGAWLVWGREADAALNPAYAAAPGEWRPLSELVAAAGVRAERVTVVDGGRATVAVQHRDAGGQARAVIVAAATAEPLGARAVDAPAFGRDGLRQWLFLLHHHLLAGETGELFLGASALLLASATGLGLWIALPWRRLCDVRRWRLARQRAWGWHRMLGVLTAAAMLPLSLTGAYLIWGKEIRAAIGPPLGMVAPPEAKTRPAGAPAVGLDAAWATARRAFPDAAFVSVALPGAKAAEYRFRLLQPGEARALFGTTALWVDAASGRVVWRYDALRAPMANRVADALFAVHTGEVAGVAGRVLVTAAGLALPALWGTGVWLWALRRRRGRAPSGAVAVAAE